MKANEALLGRDLFGEIVKPDIKGILKNKFLIPPFSVLSARDGDWQNRKRQWLQLGIQSEVGRGENLQGLSPANEEYRYNKDAYLARIGRGKLANGKGLARCFGQDLMKGENPNFGKPKMGNLPINSVFRPSEDAGNPQSQSGTSIFDPVLCELMYSWFCKDGGQILDPFCGGSVRGIVASVMGYKYWGCDLRQEQIDANYSQIDLCPDNKPVWVCGDALEKVKEAPESDFIFSCPPYGNLEVYSDDPRDISNMDYFQFIETLEEIVKLLVSKLKDNRFACFVVGDFRDKKGFYNNFVSHTIDCFLRAGTRLYNEIILVTPVGSLPIRITKQFEASRKIGKTHQNVLVFCKGIPPRFGDGE